jgi:hypothetical protein
LHPPVPKPRAPFDRVFGRLFGQHLFVALAHAVAAPQRLQFDGGL